MADLESPYNAAYEFVNAAHNASQAEAHLDVEKLLEQRDAAIREAERAVSEGRIRELEAECKRIEVLERTFQKHRLDLYQELNAAEKRIAELETEREELYSARDLLRDRLQTVITIVERALAEQSRRLAQLEREPVHVVAAAKAAGWGDSPRLLSEFVTWQGARIRELAAKVPRWIPVKERLPEYGVSVIARDEFYGQVGEAAYWSHSLGGSWEFAGPRKDDCSVTHWMPLPSPPAEPAQEEP